MAWRWRNTIGHPGPVSPVTSRADQAPETKESAKQTILSSGLFDAAFYVSQYPLEPEFSSDPVEHYLKTGAARGYDPHRLFSTAFYASAHPESSVSGMNPLYHYLTEGAANGWQPHPLFDIEYYLERYSDAANSGKDPVLHYLETGADAGYNPHPLFDTSFYYQMNPDVKQAGINALLHFLYNGGFEGRDPHRWFDSSYYNERNPDVVKVRMNPLVHYIQFGAAEDRAPHPLFRNRHWEETHPHSQKGYKALVEFVSEVDEQGKHPFVALQFRGLPRQRLSGSPDSGSAGVNIIGWPRLEIGFGEYVRQIARAFASATSRFGIRDVSLMQPGDPGDDSVVDRIIPDSVYKTNLFVLNADNMLFTCERLGFECVRNRFNIAMWAWELSDFPDVWRREMSVVDEFWAGSAFNQQCLAMKAEVPVLHMPQPVTISPGEGLARADFGIPENSFVFLFQFDFTAFIDRKNPYASIAAFRKAFPRQESAATLVIKTNNSERYPEEMRRLTDAVGNDPNIVVLSGTFRRKKVMSLMSACDAFVSLHRSEGFGRSLAEAMLMGKPVIATNYSGNTEFMRPDNSCLVNYTLVPVQKGQYPHAGGQVWAEADVDHAAWHMRRLIENREYREVISNAARETIAEDYSLEKTGARYLRRLRLLGLI